MMKAKRIIKRTVDVLMTVALLFLMGYQFWGEQFHEWAGAGMFVLFIAHQILNFRWYKSLFKGKYTPMRIFQVIVDMLTLLSMAAMMYSGIVLSRYVFAFLPINGGMALARKLHILGAYWGFLLMSLHLGLHWNMVLGVIKKKDNTIAHFRFINLFCFVAGLLIALYGAIVFVQRDFLSYMLLKNEFVFMDYEEPKLSFYLDYSALMGTCIFIAHYLGKIFREFKVKRKETQQ